MSSNKCIDKIFPISRQGGERSRKPSTEGAVLKTNTENIISVPFYNKYEEMMLI